MQSKEQIIIDELIQPPYLRRYQHNSKPEQTKKTIGKDLISPSKRLTLTYIVLFIWVALAVFGIIMETDLIALGVYFVSGMPLILGYLWGETSRPSGSIKDISKLVESMTIYNGSNDNNSNRYNPNRYYPNRYDTNNNHEPTPHNNNPNINQTTVIIISDDNSERLEIKESELDTLINSGYVNKTKGKYTFRREKKEEIVSLIDGNEMRDDGIYAEEEAAI